MSQENTITFTPETTIVLDPESPAQWAASQANLTNNTRKNGVWSDARRRAALEAAMEIRPFEQKRNKVGAAWSKVAEATNKADSGLDDLCERTIKDFVRDYVKGIEEEYRKERAASGSSNGESDIDIRALS